MEDNLKRRMASGFTHIIDGPCLSTLVDETTQFLKHISEDAGDVLKELLLDLFHWKCVLDFYV